MIVVDASALLELLLQTDRADVIASRVLASDVRMHAPHLLNIEVTQALRRLAQHRQVAATRASQALEDYQHLAIQRHAHEPLLERIWQLRSSITAYDAAYVALAEALAAPLLTCDARLARSRGHRADIIVA